jgi:hypothetical protein
MLVALALVTIVATTKQAADDAAYLINLFIGYMWDWIQRKSTCLALPYGDFHVYVQLRTEDFDETQRRSGAP